MTASSSRRTFSRRQFLRAGATTVLTAPFWQSVLERSAHAHHGRASRIVFFYFPDGIVGPSASGQSSLWHPTGGEFEFTLGPQMQSILHFKDECLFFDGLSSGPTDSGSHPGGAKKLLTAVDGGNGESIDHLLARTVGADAPHRHVLLGAMANHNNASGDKHISYPRPGQSIAPEDSPARAFSRLFGGGIPQTGGNDEQSARLRRKRSVLDASIADVLALRQKLGKTERSKLDLHLEALREVEQRVDAMPKMMAGDRCTMPQSPGVPSELYDPANFPEILDAQLDLLVEAMACGLTRVGVVQCSHHTSELIMSRFPGTPMHDPGFDMRSHQASHYGARHDENHREYRDYLRQRQWWVERYASLIERLRSRPEGDGTMLDHSIVVLMSEVADGNTHLHDRLPFVVAGRAGGRISPGRFLRFDYARHANLWVSLAQAMGHQISHFGDASSGPLPGVLS